jgi:hypothetical protein
MNGRPSLLMAASLVALSALWAGGAAVASPARSVGGSSCGVWRLIPAPSPTPDSQFHDVDALAANDAWSVGSMNGIGVTQTLAEHWDGRRWSTVPSPNPQAVDWLDGVSAVSRSNVWAVGEQGDPGPAVALHWDGTSWTSAEPPELQDINILKAVDAVSSDDVWAVGTSRTLDIEAYGWPLVEHWDGSAWSVVSAPLVRQFNELLGVRAFGPDDVWVVGRSYGANQDFTTLIMHWDGAAWTVVPSELLGTLQGIAGVSSSDLWAVGESSGRILFRHWDGLRWSTQVGPPGTLDGADAGTAQDIWAVGSHFDGKTLPLTAHWDGTRWRMVDDATNQNAGALLGDAVLPSGAVMAAGWATMPGGQATVTLSEGLVPC